MKDENSCYPGKKPDLLLTRRALPTLQVSPKKAMNPRFIDPSALASGAKSNALKGAKVS